MLTYHIQHQNRFIEQIRNNDGDSSRNASREKQKGFTATTEALRVVYVKERFRLTAFGSLGGFYTNDKDRRESYYRYVRTDNDSLVIRDDTYSYNSEMFGITGQVGVMPWYTWGAFSGGLKKFCKNVVPWTLG